MSEIKVVTAFFDIGRSDYDICKRTNDQYFEYFKFWARLRNHLVVYCESDDAERIIQIRREYGLEEKTTVITVDDFYSLESDIFKKMENIEASEEFQDFRYRYGDPSNKAKYNYVMLMKWWCVANTAKNCSKDEYIAWLDFGYNHGGERYINSEDFDFLWDYDFPQKINLFCLCNPDNMSLIDSLQFQTDCFIGHTAIIAQPLCELYWQYMKDAMKSLLRIGCMDDDQYLQLMVYKEHKEEHSIIICDWFEDFQKCSNHSFAVKEFLDDKNTNTEEITGIRKARIKIAQTKNTVLDSYKLASGKKSWEDEISPFCKRMRAKEKKYYG